MDIVLDQTLRARILTTAADTDGRHDLVDATMSAGASTPLHLHTRYEERLWVLEGSLTATVDTETRVLTSGEFLYVPFRTPHALTAGPDGGRALLVTSPAGFAELLTRTGTPAHLATSETELDLALFAHVSEELGDQLLTPPKA
ncbi:MAG TPA: cupin domain-containing protein [Streptosporangiaceae bacterium]|jgi:quercetin dioxygenase-like cupin family protein